MFVNRKIVLHFIFLVILGFLFSFCNRPKEVLNRKHMEKLMYDVYIAEAMIENDYQTFSTPQQKEALIKQVFDKHDVTQAEWDTSLAWYSDRIEVYLKMNDSVKARLQRQQKVFEQQLNQQYSQQQNRSQRFNTLSYIPSTYSFSEVSPRNGFRFRLDSMQIVNKITSPQFEFSFDVIGIPSGYKPAIKSFLTLEYTDTTIYLVNNITENRTYTDIARKFLENDTLSSVAGFIKLQERKLLDRNIQLYNVFLGNPADKRENFNQEPGNDRILQRQEMILEENSTPQ